MISKVLATLAVVAAQEDFQPSEQDNKEYCLENQHLVDLESLPYATEGLHSC